MLKGRKILRLNRKAQRSDYLKISQPKLPLQVGRFSWKNVLLGSFGIASILTCFEYILEINNPKLLMQNIESQDQKKLKKVFRTVSTMNSNKFLYSSVEQLDEKCLVHLNNENLCVRAGAWKSIANLYKRKIGKVEENLDFLEKEFKKELDLLKRKEYLNEEEKSCLRSIASSYSDILKKKEVDTSLLEEILEMSDFGNQGSEFSRVLSQLCLNNENAFNLKKQLPFVLERVQLNKERAEVPLKWEQFYSFKDGMYNIHKKVKHLFSNNLPSLYQDSQVQQLMKAVYSILHSVEQREGDLERISAKYSVQLASAGIDLKKSVNSRLSIGGIAIEELERMDPPYALLIAIPWSVVGASIRFFPRRNISSALPLVGISVMRAAFVTSLLPIVFFVAKTATDLYEPSNETEYLSFLFGRNLALTLCITLMAKYVPYSLFPIFSSFLIYNNTQRN